MKKTSLLNSFKYAFEGIWSAIKKERNLKIHIVIMFLVIVFGIIFNISKIEWFACILLFGGVITLEIMNTAIETTVDLITMEKKSKSKVSQRRFCWSCFSNGNNFSYYRTNDFYAKNFRMLKIIY